MQNLFTCPLKDRGVIAIEGPDAESFLQGLISNDVTKVTATQAIYGAFLTPQGKFLFDFFVTKSGDGLWLDCEAGRRGEFLKRLKMFKLRAAVSLHDLTDTYAVSAVFGNDAASALGIENVAGCACTLDDTIAFIDPRDAAMGARVIHRRAEPPGFGASVNQIEYDHRRIALVLPDGSHDIKVDKDTILEHGFERLGGVDFTKGCYLGQEVTARMKYRGLVKKQLVALHIDGGAPETGTAIHAGDIDVGEIRSSIDGRALALVRQDRLAAALERGDALIAGQQPVILLTAD